MCVCVCVCVCVCMSVRTACVRACVQDSYKHTHTQDLPPATRQPGRRAHAYETACTHTHTDSYTYASRYNTRSGVPAGKGSQGCSKSHATGRGVTVGWRHVHRERSRCVEIQRTITRQYVCMNLCMHVCTQAPATARRIFSARVCGACMFARTHACTHACMHTCSMRAPVRKPAAKITHMGPA